MDQALLRTVAARLSDARAAILERSPFFGRLLMHLSFGFSDCGTAYTDMRRIVFDPSFASVLKDEELQFVLLHEVLHCVLKHCTRGSGKLHLLYNVACDIVVNSILLEAMGRDEMLINKSPAMHLAPDGKEGRCYSAEEVYQMLVKGGGEALLTEYEEGSFDSHEIWTAVFSDRLMEERWNKQIAGASRATGYGESLPEGIERLVEEVRHTSKINWRQILHDFIQCDKNDYTFSVPDKRYSGDIVMPSFREDISGNAVEKLWFAVDTSGSVTDEALTEAVSEIRGAMEQIGSLSGSISFFDHRVYDPVPFENTDDLLAIKPKGGGGTNFKAVFEFMKSYFAEELPRAVIIMTDGYDDFPDEGEALGVPVIWLMVNSRIRPPWGECVRIYIDHNGGM